jgi:ATP-dependent Lon protease
MKDEFSEAVQPTLLNLLADSDSQPEPQVIGVAGGESSQQVQIPEALPILVIRNLVVFPGTVVPLSIRRKSSRQLLDESLSQSKVIGLMTQKKAEIEQPGPEDIHPVGVAALVLKMIRQPDETVLLVVQALQRIALQKITQTSPYIRAEVQVLKSTPPPENDNEFEAMYRNLRETAGKLVELSPDVPDQARVLIMNIDEPSQLTDFIASTLALDVPRKQDILEQTDVVKRVRAVQEAVNNQLQIAQIQQRLQDDVASHMSDAQRRAYLREQLKAIQRELGETGGAEEQVETLRKRLDEAAPPEQVMEQADRELKRLEYVPPASPEYSVIIGYLETIAGLPWNKLSKDNLDLDQAQRILDRDHYDLQKVKRRLIEYLAVRKLNPEGRGPILCFLGPPGVGKTSLGQSIADALGRKFSRMSLGGIRDEAEIRGHRRTYIGAMPGRLIQELRRLGTRNPVIMLDEVDKIGADFRGDPAAALLEVLDPRQNNAFVDRFLDVPFDLSQVIFIATANYMDPVPPALRDRMEVIEIPGYTEHEKLQIAMSYIVRRQLKENGLKPEQCEWTDEAVTRIINSYTHEAGVRELERQVSAVCRAIAAKIARDETKFVRVTPEVVSDLLGPAKYVREERLKTSKPGVVTGLAYTPYGGEILYIEATKYSGKGNILLTGQIGNVMKESAQAALSLVRTRAEELGIPADAFKENDIHVHVPSGAVPKDGPSAGIAMFTAIASLFTGTPVRNDVAMTGEITLRGLVLPIGGLKEKSLAAMRAGIETVLIPKLNEKDLPDVPEEARRQLNFVPVETVDQVLENGLEHPIHHEKGEPIQV